MSKLIGNALRSARRAKGLTQQQVAESVGVSRAAVAQWEKGSTEPSTMNLVQACNFLDINLVAATSGMVRVGEPTVVAGKVYRQVSDRRPEFEDTVGLIYDSVGGKKLASAEPVPVRSVGLSASLNRGEFLIGGEVIDFVDRPPGAARTKDLIAFNIPVESLAPRFEIGDIAFATGAKPPRAGDDVVIEFSSGGEAGAGRAVLRRLVSQDDESIEVRTFTPERAEKLERTDIRSIYRILTARELLGIFA